MSKSMCNSSDMGKKMYGKGKKMAPKKAVKRGAGRKK